MREWCGAAGAGLRRRVAPIAAASFVLLLLWVPRVRGGCRREGLSVGCPEDGTRRVLDINAEVTEGLWHG